MLKITLVKDTNVSKHQIILASHKSNIASLYLPKADEAAVKVAQKEKAAQFQRTEAEKSLTILFIDESKEAHVVAENVRLAASGLVKFLNGQKTKDAVVSSVLESSAVLLAFAEGAAMSSYQFLKYKTLEKKANTLTSLAIASKSLTTTDVARLATVVEANFLARDLVNEPLSYLTAVQLSKEIQKAGKNAGFSVTVFDKKKITALKMGGLLAVNKGSIDPPTFTVLEYKPAKAKNKQPLVLVGKGVVYDTGGLSLKPTANSMDMMKCDMGGAATVVGAMTAIAKLKLPYYIVGLIPATDNRPGQEAYVPGDVVQMMNGINVEVLNTDAEGRMILGDALAYASKYKPSLVLDFATLTGAAKAAIGSYGTIFMGTADTTTKQQLLASGNNVFERLVEFPFWDDYKKLVKSEVADIKNVGGSEAGMITAGKFLEYFTNYPWLHFDIAGTAYLMSEDSYRGRYGTGVGVRMLVDFVTQLSTTDNKK